MALQPVPVSDRAGNHMQNIVPTNSNGKRLRKNSLQGRVSAKRLSGSLTKAKTSPTGKIFDFRSFDVNHDGSIDRDEATLVAKYAVELGHSRTQAWNSLRRAKPGAPEPIDDATVAPSKDTDKQRQ
jgi:hypothetical protein